MRFLGEADLKLLIQGFARLAEVMFALLRRGATSAFEETGRMHPLVIWTGHRAAFREHCQAGAELLHSHGSPEWRQVS